MWVGTKGLVHVDWYMWVSTCGDRADCSWLERKGQRWVEEPNQRGSVSS